MSLATKQRFRVAVFARKVFGLFQIFRQSSKSIKVSIKKFLSFFALSTLTQIPPQGVYSHTIQNTKVNHFGFTPHLASDFFRFDSKHSHGYSGMNVFAARKDIY